MAGDLEAARVALTNLALGTHAVLVYDGRWQQPDQQQALMLASDPTLLPALIVEGRASIYAIPPDIQALKVLMGYVMGQAPSASEALLRDQIRQAQEDHAAIAMILREHVPPEYLAPVAAELERLAGYREAAEPSGQGR